MQVCGQQDYYCQGYLGLAFLSAREGETERAVELYALAARHPFVAKSRWFEDVIGRHIAEAAATLPPEVTDAARDLEASLAEWLAG